MPHRQRPRCGPNLSPLGGWLTSSLEVLACPLPSLAFPRPPTAQVGLRVTASRRSDMFRPTKLELVRGTERLTAVAAGAHTERLAADAALAKAADKILDGAPATGRLCNRFEGADSCHADRHSSQNSSARGCNPGRSPQRGPQGTLMRPPPSVRWSSHKKRSDCEERQLAHPPPRTG